MKAASIDELKKELKELPPKKLLDLTLRLARFKKENKELLSYLLFDAGNESGYIESIRIEMQEEFALIQKGPASPIKKQLRRMLRMINRQCKYLGNKNAIVELLLHFCNLLKQHDPDLFGYSGIYTIYDLQLKKIARLIPAIDEDLQFDYMQNLKKLEGEGNVAEKQQRSWWKRKKG